MNNKFKISIKTIKNKLVFAFLSILILCVGSIVLFYLNIRNLNSNLEKSNIKTQAIIEISKFTEELYSNQMSIIFQTSKESVEGYSNIYYSINKNLTKCKENINSSDEDIALKNVEAQLSNYNQLFTNKIKPSFDKQYNILINSSSFSISEADELEEGNNKTVKKENSNVSNQYSDFLKDLEKNFEASRSRLDKAKDNTLNAEGKYIVENMQKSINNLETIYLENNKYSLVYAKRNLTNISVILILSILTIGVILSITMGSLITKSIMTLIGKMKLVEKGDFSVSFEENREDEFRLLGASFEKMVDTLKNLILNMKQTSKTLCLDSFNMNEIVVKTEHMANTIIGKNNNMLQKLEETSTMLVYSNNAMSDIASASTQISVNSDSMIQGTKAIVDSASNSTEISNEVYKKVNNINSIKDEVNEAVKSLLGHSKSIEKVVETIDDISKRTKLIAINASIEAARAGISGAGFAVVAEEIRKLSEQSSQSTKGVSDIIKSVQKEIGNVLKYQQLSDGVIKETVEFTYRTKEEIERISSEATKFSKIVTEITQAYNGFANDLTCVSYTINDSNEVFKNAKDEIQSNINSTNDMAGEIKKISNLSEDIDKIADKLNSLIDYFNISNEKT